MVGCLRRCGTHELLVPGFRFQGSQSMESLQSRPAWVKCRATRLQGHLCEGSAH